MKINIIDSCSGHMVRAFLLDPWHTSFKSSRNQVYLLRFQPEHGKCLRH